MKFHKKLILIQIICICSICYPQFSGGTGIPEDPYQIATAVDLNNVRNYLASCFIQNSNIDLGVAPWNVGEGWEPLGFSLSYNPYDISNAFSGNYNGNGYAIENLYINRPDSSLVGLFGWTWDAEISNVTVSNNCNVTGNDNVGILVGYSSNSNITGSKCLGTVTGDYAVGGFIGDINGSSVIEECSSDCKVTGNSDVGGFSGSCRTTSTLNILNCNSSGTITGISNTGGLIGYSSGKIIVKDCYTDVFVNGYSNSGGFIGYAGRGNRISRSFSTGNVASTGINTGGFAGDIYSSLSFGDSTIVSDCFSRGNIRGYTQAGGFIGIVLDSYVYKCYSTGTAEADSAYVGGFVGRNVRGEYLSSYWDIETSGVTSSAAGVGRTTAEMILPYGANTYVSWDFVNVWRDDITNQNNGYPTFLWVSGIAEDDDTNLPGTATLYQNYPNPFNPNTDIRFTLQAKSDVKLSVFNSKGELVITLFEGRKDKGLHTIGFDASGLNSGLYFYKLTSEGTTEIRKMLLLK